MSNSIDIQVKLLAQQANKNLKELDGNLQKNTRATENLSKATAQSSSTFKIFAGNLAAIGVAKLTQSLASAVGSMVNFGVSSVDAANKIENLRNEFGDLTGSAETAGVILKDLTNFAATTPFELKELADTQKTLLAFGVSVEESQNRLKQFADISSSTGVPLERLADSFGKVNIEGRVTTRVLDQLSREGVQIGPALAQAAGVSEEALGKLVQTGKVTSDQLRSAFDILTSEGGQAFNGVANASATLEGRLAILSSQFQKFREEIGQRLAPAIKAIVAGVTELFTAFSNTGAVDSVLDSFSNLIPRALEFTINTFSFLINTVFNVLKGFNVLRAGIAKAVSLIVQAFTVMADVYVKVLDAFGMGNTVVGRAVKGIQSFRDQVVESLDDTAAAFMDKASSIQESQDRVNGAIEKSREVVKRVYEEEVKAIDEANNAKNISDANRVSTVAQLSEEELRLLEEREKQKAQLLLKIEEMEQTLAEQKVARELFLSEQEKIFQDERLLEFEGYLERDEQARLQAAINAAQTEEQKQIAILKAQDAGFKAREQRERQALQQSLAFDRQMSQNKLDLARATGTSLLQVMGADNKAMFALTKAFAAGDIVVRGLQGMALATAQLGAAAPPVIAKIKAQTGIQLATLAATAIGEASRFEQGGIVPGQSMSGDNVLARVNSGEMILNRQQQARLFDMANQGGGQGGQEIVVHTTVELDGEAVGRSVSRQVANGLQLGEVQ